MSERVRTDRTARDTLVRVQALTKTYREGERERAVLRGVDAEIAPGAFVALVGRSGSGKSTLLTLIGGLDSPTAGRIHIGDFEVTAADERARTRFRRRHIGFVFQAFNLVPTLTVAENVALSLELNGLPDAGRTQVVLAEVGLADRGDSFPDRLSGGEQQRVAIARALVHRPRLLLADEPTGNLDYETGRRVMDLLHRLVRQTGTTLLVVTHDRDFLQASDRVLTLRDGRLVEMALSPEAP